MKPASVVAIACRPFAHVRQFWLQRLSHVVWIRLAPWQDTTTGRVRKYLGYRHYLWHQKSKWWWHRAGLAKVYAKRCAAFQVRFQSWAIPGMSVLCLGALDGCEVDAFRRLRCFAWGIDLAHPEHSPYVVTGDFHHLDRHFPAVCVEVVYTNVLDHVLDLGQLSAQVQRLVKPQGWWWVDVLTAGMVGGAYESQDWPDLATLQGRIKALGWTLEEAKEFEQGVTSMRWSR